MTTLVHAMQDRKVQFVFIGEGGKKKKLQDLAIEKKLKNVLFLPYQDKEILPYSLSCADLSVVSLERGLDCVAAPCKLYTSLSAGQVILGLVDDFSDVGKIIDKYECGFSVAQEDTEALVKIINKLLRNPDIIAQYKINARRCFEENFRKEEAMEKYKDIFLKSFNQAKFKNRRRK